MKLLLLLLVFLPLSIAAPEDDKGIRFCCVGCPYVLKTESPNAQFNVKKMMDKCRNDPKVPKILCQMVKDHDNKFGKWVEERYKWHRLCSVWCEGVKCVK